MPRPAIHPPRWFGRMAIVATVMSLAAFGAAGAVSAATTSAAKSAGTAASQATSEVVPALLLNMNWYAKNAATTV